MPPNSLQIALLEPYYGGSHAVFVDTLCQHSRHSITAYTLPPRKWKWRMRGAAMWFVREADEWLDQKGGAVDLILCNDMLSVADLRALLPIAARTIPIVCYFHENQLTYPIPDEQERDFQYGMTNITSCLAADAVWFNSCFHRDDFLAAAGALLKKMPDCVPKGIVKEIRAKSDVMPPAVGVPNIARTARRGPVPTILWCHRWEYDKNPEPFFDAVIRLADSGRDFRLVLLGEQFRTAPPVFAKSWDRLRPHIEHAGYVPDRDAYWAMLRRCDLVVSTAIQENFGIAVVEAILAGCQPLLPDRLAYRELIPQELQRVCLYPNDADLFDRLIAYLDGREHLTENQAQHLIRFARDSYAAPAAVDRLDKAMTRVAVQARNRP